MLTVITGGSKCGKSSIAEDILSRFNGKKIYIATMEPYCKEAHAAIERHREMRLGKGFETVEKYTDIHELDLPDRCGVLLECACNLMANEMFSAGEKEPVRKIIKGIGKLSERASEVIIVTNSVGEDGIEYPKETMDYIKNMGILNCALSERADRVIEAVYGIPVMLKGSLWQ
ncbi:MAG: bifunctional adenosylcobinamide kinase/adenosylcobinamide-phosphate guanylyltransferase [Oscillospiraceae bacterium]|nr:bifunctional adenosylcobinamide kinase/adenosylcobinamide-phosphate guanylyltransferase [Oscillospiraceae bacterium]